MEPANAAVEQPYRATGYQMIESVVIRNFRSFDDAEISDCRRVNVIVGENGSGKTALLEGIFLAAGASPEIAMRTRAWRGIEFSQVSGTHKEIEHALWGDLFHRFNTKQPAYIGLSSARDASGMKDHDLSP